MKVKIIKASKPTYWYANKIGCVFEVKEVIWRGKKEYRLIKDNSYIIHIEDTITEKVKVILV
jgi:hypothetical protein